MMMNKVFRFIGRNVKESYLGWKSFFSNKEMWIDFANYILLMILATVVFMFAAYITIEILNYFSGIAHSLQSIAESLATMRGL